MKEMMIKPRLLSKSWWKKEWIDTKLLFRSVPAITLSLMVLSTVLMNMLAGVALVNESWIALDAGIIVAFVGFLLGDMLVKRFGPKAAIKVIIFSLIVNIAICSIFTAVGQLVKAGAYGMNVDGQVLYPIFDESGVLIAEGVDTIGSFFAGWASKVQWWIIAASATAFLFSGIIDSIIHTVIRKAFKKNPNGLPAHIASAWGSTFVGQFLDNLVFALLFTFPASIVGLWGMERMSVLALLMFAFAGAVVELICQALFTPIGFRVAERWRRTGVGQAYVDVVPDAHGKEQQTERHRGHI